MCGPVTADGTIAKQRRGEIQHVFAHRFTIEAGGDVYLADLTPKKPYHAPGHKHAEAPADPDLALAAVRAAGWSTSQAMHRRPKHYEVLAHRDGGHATEPHVDFAGATYKQKVAEPAKWKVEA